MTEVKRPTPDQPGGVGEASSEAEPSVALVTGAGGGLGRGLALALGRRGHAVVVTARRAPTGEAVADEILAQGGQAIAVPCDVTDRSSIDAAMATAMDRYGRIDAIFHNATAGGSSVSQSLEEPDPQVWEAQMTVGLRAAFHLAQAGYAALSASRGSYVVFSSVDGIDGNADRPLYAVVKAAQRTFVKALAREWGPLGIRVNAVAPAGTSEQTERLFADDPAMGQAIVDRIPLGRLGDPVQDVGAAIALLADPATNYITGQTWMVDGGLYLGL